MTRTPTIPDNSDSATTVALVSEPSGVVIARQATVANTPLKQLRGWIGRRDIDTDSALGFPRCSWIHSFGMRFPLDIAYCDRDGRTLRVVAGLQPNRIAPYAQGAFWAWEMRAAESVEWQASVGFAGRVAVGDRLILRTIRDNDARSNGNY